MAGEVFSSLLELFYNNLTSSALQTELPPLPFAFSLSLWYDEMSSEPKTKARGRN
jgi:hypothetical protein